MGDSISLLYMICANGIIYSLAFGLIAQRKRKQLIMGIAIITWPFIFPFLLLPFSALL